MGRRLRLKLFSNGSFGGASGVSIDEYGDHTLAPCTDGVSEIAVSRDGLHNDARDFIQENIVTLAKLPACLEPAGIVPDTQRLKATRIK